MILNVVGHLQITIGKLLIFLFNIVHINVLLTVNVHPEKLRLRLRVLPQIEIKDTIDTLTDRILRKM